MRKKLVVFLAVLMLAAVFTGCGGTKTDLAYIESKGKIIMGLDDAFPPMGFRDDNNEIVGFDVDLAKEVAKRMDVELVLQPIDWSAKDFELKNKNIDLIWNGMSLSEENKASMTCSDPYMYNEQILIVSSDSDITKKADLAGKTIALQDGSTAAEALDKDTAFKDSLKGTVFFTDNVKALLDLKNGQVDAVLVDSILGSYYVNMEPEAYVILDESLAAEEYGIGFRKGDEGFRDEIQKYLDEMVADGTFKTISEKWFGTDVSIAK